MICNTVCHFKTDTLRSAFFSKEFNLFHLSSVLERNFHATTSFCRLLRDCLIDMEKIFIKCKISWLVVKEDARAIGSLSSPHFSDRSIDENDALVFIVKGIKVHFVPHPDFILTTTTLCTIIQLIPSFWKVSKRWLCRKQRNKEPGKDLIYFKTLFKQQLFFPKMQRNTTLHFVILS